MVMGNGRNPSSALTFRGDMSTRDQSSVATKDLEVFLLKFIT